MKNKVLFVCINNTGRSQIAAVLFNKYALSDWLAESAGTADITEPTMRERAAVKPAAQLLIDVVKEVEGIDISEYPRRKMTEEMLPEYAKIIIMAEKETLPEYLRNYDYTYWDIPDFVSKDRAGFYESLEVVRSHVYTLVAEL